MHFRNKSIADSVAERIAGIADSVQNNTAMPPPRGAAIVNMDRQENGDLMVTKTFENGESELLTISNQQPSSTEPPQGIVQIGGDQAAPEQQPLTGIDSGGIVEAAALGGDSLDALLKG